MMDLNELQSAQSRERQTDSLQQLRESFYKDAGEFIQQLHRERERAAEEADDPWDAPEVNRLSDDIDTAEGTVEAIYERRVGKIVKMASLAAADMPTEDEGLTTEERSLFETLVGAIEENRARVEAVIDGENPAAAAADVESTVPPADGPGPAQETGDPADTGAPTDAPAERPPAERPPDSPTPDATDADPHDAVLDAAPEPAGADGDRREVPSEPDDLGDAPGTPPSDATADASGVDAADLMGDGSETAESLDSDREPSNEGARDHPPQADGGSSAVGTEADAPSPSPAGVGEEPDAAEPGPDESAGGSGDADPSVDRATVKITSDVGEIFGVDQRSYDLTAEDVVTLPEANAGPLIDSDAAERLD